MDAPPPDPTDVCTLDDFRAFFTVHLYDTMGRGSFWRYLLDANGRSEQWAQELVQQTERVAATCRGMITRIAAVRRIHHPLSKLLTAAMINPSRPDIPEIPGGVCTIIGLPCEHTIDVTAFVQSANPSTASRPRLPAAPSVYVDAAYSPVAGLAWLSTNVERVVHAIANEWLANTARHDAAESSGDPAHETYADVAAHMERDTEGDTVRLYHLYVAAHKQVGKVVEEITASASHTRAPPQARSHRKRPRSPD